MDRFKGRSIPEPVAIAICEQCNDRIYEGYGVTVFEDGYLVHEECEAEYVSRSFVYKRGVISEDGIL